MNAPDSETPKAEAKPQSWLAKNFMPVLSTIAAVAFIVWKGLYVWDIFVAALGLGLVIFLHELGHFLAAKWCDVHVSAFSIGFGKPVPGCSFKYGETTYKLGWIPLGGYVQMVGEGDNADSEEAEDDPRSFKNKSVYQRMLIISAGVIMNLILGITCFVIAYSHGVEEPPGIIGMVSPGSPAWQAGIRADSIILQIGGIEKPTYPDIRTKVMSSSKGDEIPLKLRHRDGTEETITVSPKRDEGELFPTIGVVQNDQLVLRKAVGRAEGIRVAKVGSAAENAKDKDGKGFMNGDKIIACSNDPANPATVTDIPVDPLDPTNTKLDFFEFRERLHLMRAKPMTIRVDRNGEKHDLVVTPEYGWTLPGVRLQMGRISAIRNNSAASKAKPIDGTTETGLLAINPAVADSGDRIIGIDLPTPDGKVKRLSETVDPKDATASQLNPVKLPFELSEWAEEWYRTSKTPKLPAVKITVMRSPTDATQKTPRRCVYELEWDAAYRFATEPAYISQNSPLTLAGFGIAFQVQTTLDDVEKKSAAEEAGLKKSDVIVGIRHRNKNPKNEFVIGEWVEIKQHQGGFLSDSFHYIDSPEIELKVRRPVENEKREEELTLAITLTQDQSWPQNQRGFYFSQDTRTQKAEDFWEALQFGGQRTVRLVRTIYQQLYALASGRISIKSMNGPLSIGNYAYKIVGYDTWTFIVFIGMISLNLAVVNFLPIPVLDGGHMVFLIYEKIRGKPAPEKIMEWAMYLGLGCILSLMVFVIYLDVKRLFF